MKTADSVCPFKTFEIRHDKARYFTESLYLAITERKNLYKDARKKKTDSAGQTAKKKKI